mmetsp:Transcript_87799/g.268661  ORF Transcript_87799/g.268661 Transcript_87799/m.268661 type:complete len:425 (+) Transcript_87799:231-1505(+)
MWHALSEHAGTEPRSTRPLGDALVGFALPPLSKQDLARMSKLRPNEPNAPLLPNNRAILHDDRTHAAAPDVHVQKMISRVAQAQAGALDGPRVKLHNRIIEAVSGDVALLQQYRPRLAPDVDLDTAETPQAAQPSLFDGIRDVHRPGEVQVGSQYVDATARQRHNVDVQPGNVDVLVADRGRSGQFDDTACEAEFVYCRRERVAIVWNPHRGHLCIDYQSERQRTICGVVSRAYARRQFDRITAYLGTVQEDHSLFHNKDLLYQFAFDVPHGLLQIPRSQHLQGPASHCFYHSGNRRHTYWRAWRQRRHCCWSLGLDLTERWKRAGIHNFADILRHRFLLPKRGRRSHGIACATREEQASQEIACFRGRMPVDVLLARFPSASSLAGLLGCHRRPDLSCATLQAKRCQQAVARVWGKQTDNRQA